METEKQQKNTTNNQQLSINSATHTETTYYRVEVDSDKEKLDKQHRDHRWINTMKDDLHPYIKEMIENTGLFR